MSRAKRYSHRASAHTGDVFAVWCAGPCHLPFCTSIRSFQKHLNIFFFAFLFGSLWFLFVPSFFCFVGFSFSHFKFMNVFKTMDFFKMCVFQIFVNIFTSTNFLPNLRRFSVFCEHFQICDLLKNPLNCYLCFYLNPQSFFKILIFFQMLEHFSNRKLF